METPTPGVHCLETLTSCLFEDLIYNVPYRDLQRLIADWDYTFSQKNERERWHLSPNDIDDIIDAIAPNNQRA